MPFTLARSDIRYRALAVLATTALTGGCAFCPTLSTQDTETASSNSVPVVRQGRYTLVEVGPNDAQQDLMRQIVDIALPTAEDATVGDALHVALLRSGYRLCTDHEDTTALSTLPLPAVHNPLGPLTLRKALEVLAGRGWQLDVDDAAREVCFTRRP